MVALLGPAPASVVSVPVQRCVGGVPGFKRFSSHVESLAETCQLSPSWADSAITSEAFRLRLNTCGCAQMHVSHEAR